jgi:hypothetical protein
VKILELIAGILVLGGILFLYLIIRQFYDLDTAIIGLIVIIYLQQMQIRKIKKDLNERNNL